MTSLECTCVDTWDFPGGPSDKEATYQCRRHKSHGFDPWIGKIPWKRAKQPTAYSCLENPMDRGAWRATVHGVTQSRTQSNLARAHTHAHAHTHTHTHTHTVLVLVPSINYLVKQISKDLWKTITEFRVSSE